MTHDDLRARSERLAAERDALREYFAELDQIEESIRRAEERIEKANRDEHTFKSHQRERGTGYNLDSPQLRKYADRRSAAEGEIARLRSRHAQLVAHPPGSKPEAAEMRHITTA